MSHFTETKELCSLPDGHECNHYSCVDLERQEAEQGGYEDRKTRHEFGHSLDHDEYSGAYADGWALAIEHERRKKSA